MGVLSIFLTGLAGAGTALLLDALAGDFLAATLSFVDQARLAYPLNPFIKKKPSRGNLIVPEIISLSKVF